MGAAGPAVGRLVEETPRQVFAERVGLVGLKIAPVELTARDPGAIVPAAHDVAAGVTCAVGYHISHSGTSATATCHPIQAT